MPHADNSALPLAVSMGEPAGVGLETLLKAYRHFAAIPPDKGPSFYLIDDPVRVESVIREASLDISIASISNPAEAVSNFQQHLPVLPLQGDDLAGLDQVTPGTPSASTARAVQSSIERGVHHALEGDAAGLVTLPIQKQALQEAGFAYPGHTDFLGALTEGTAMPEGFVRGPVMMLTAGPFRVAPVTVHIPLKDVPAAITPDSVANTIVIVTQALIRDYGIAAPKVVVSGLNPHAGEAGHLGREEIESIIPALTALRERGVDVIGPLPADTMFHEDARGQYHAAITMYHDQGLIPIKTVAFHPAVNTTLGLPIVRTSPDHGTALAIAGKGMARPDSLINAIYSASRIAQARVQFDAAQHA